jgi:hypothetical protein
LRGHTAARERLTPPFAASSAAPAEIGNAVAFPASPASGCMIGLGIFALHAWAV